MSKIALFPGSFDPFTKGHEDIVLKSLQIFDKVIIGIGVNSSKKNYFDLEKRISHIKSLFINNEKVEILTYSKLTINFCKEVGADFIVRGLRDNKDFEYEKSIAHMNNELSNIETIFILTSQKYGAINSSIVREIFKNKGEITSFVTNAELLV